MIPHPDTVALARRVLTDVEYLTWALHEGGMTQRDIAWWRRRSKGTIADTLRRAEDKIREARRGADQDSQAARRRRA